MVLLRLVWFDFREFKWLHAKQLSLQPILTLKVQNFDIAIHPFFTINYHLN